VNLPMSGELAHRLDIFLRDEIVDRLRIAVRDQLVEVLVVDNLIGGQNEVVVVNLDVALGNDAVALGIVEQLIGLHVERLRPVDLRLGTEHAAR